MTSTSLGDFCAGKTSDEYYEISKKVVTTLGYVHPDMTLAMDHNALTMVWEMHEYAQTAVHLCAALEQLYLRFCYQKSKQFKESDSTQNEFLSVLIHVADRHAPAEGEESLQQLLRIESTEDGKQNEEALELWVETEETLRKQKAVIDGMDIPDDQKALLHLEIPPGAEEGSIGPPLDKGVYEMMVYIYSHFD